MSDLIIGVGGIVLQNQVNSYSVSFVAGYSATNRLYGLLETSGIALGSAFSTFIGQNYGAEKYGRIRTCTKRAIVVALCIAVVILTFTSLLRVPLLSLFVDTSTADGSEVLAYGTQYLLIMPCFSRRCTCCTSSAPASRPWATPPSPCCRASWSFVCAWARC